MMLILLQPDFGTFIVFAVVVAGVLLMAGVHVRYLLALVGGSVLAILAALRLEILREYQIDRLTAFLDPENTDSLAAGYNVVQAQIAVGSGQFFGQGIGSGSQTTSGFVPENQTDFHLHGLVRRTPAATPPDRQPVAARTVGPRTASAPTPPDLSARDNEAQSACGQSISAMSSTARRSSSRLPSTGSMRSAPRA